jgi:phosphate transport system permease protein
MLAVAYADGRVGLFQVTSSQELALVAAPKESGRIERLAISPKEDAVLALAEHAAPQWAINAPHPEVTLASILGKVWYEGYERPEHVWQSSSGTDEFEPKYGLAPLVFGTLKATFYSMLFGAPLAFLAAIYTSEFLHPRVRVKVKPTIEVMASLPSVVLGFLAALFFAPLVEDVVPQFLTAFITVPFAYLLGAHLWQLVPRPLAVRLWMVRTALMIAVLPLGIGLAALLGGVVERWLFAGNIKTWLDGQIGTGTGAWMFLLLPLSAVATVGLSNAFISTAFRRHAGHWSRESFALLELAKFLALCVATLLAAYALSAALNASGWDPRGSWVGSYVQRNALIVGCIMGFAIIPIIYTISDDALAAVPESLRAGSLGAGATPWQTALRVVIPTAMSGLFSALMIGLGRAVGETMIVLMAAGNTPVMEMNIFNGFRTLSANIATELPEAVNQSTHYRMLFLAALTLFFITFLVNTVAEVVRLRFRKRAFQL